MLVMIDNYDSFTYNIVQYFAELDQSMQVFRNDEIDIKYIRKMEPKGIVISPGPCTPNEAGISMPLIKEFGGIIPILGVCLGHQSIGQVFGGKVVCARQVMHGKISPVYHTKQGIFHGINNPFNVTRYNSLVVEWESLPTCLEVTAWTCHENGDKDEIMGLRHKSKMIEGVQFHPESIMTEQGHDLFENFIKQVNK